jgi:hypothetical protein
MWHCSALGSTLLDQDGDQGRVAPVGPLDTPPLWSPEVGATVEDSRECETPAKLHQAALTQRNGSPGSDIDTDLSMDLETLAANNSRKLELLQVRFTSMHSSLLSSKPPPVRGCTD